SEMEPIIEIFAMSVESIDVAVGQLVCLGEALRRRLHGRLPLEEGTEAFSRLQMLIDRAIGVAAHRAAAQLEQEAFVDALTGLLNRRGLERDLGRELPRAVRHDHPLTLVIIDLIGLKTVNDIDGHPAGDSRLRALAGALRDVLRASDAAYRIGGDEFVAVLPETGPAEAKAVLDRAVTSGAPPFSWGIAACPEDGADPDALLELADRRLRESRA
ncbi:MAG: GGDEF domain-containing protein, partial [Acidimicrobiales bacterium]